MEKGVKALEEKDAVQQLRDGGLGKPYDLLLSTIEVSFTFYIVVLFRNSKVQASVLRKGGRSLKHQGSLRTH